MDEQPTPNDKPPDPPPLLQQNISGHDSRIQGGNIIRGDAVFNSLPPHGAVFNGPVTIYNMNPEAQPLPNVPSPTTTTTTAVPSTCILPSTCQNTTRGATSDHVSSCLAPTQPSPPSSDDAWPPYLHITSTGPASDWQATALGLYQKMLPSTTHEGKPVFRQMNDVGTVTSQRYLWCDSKSVWRISSKVGGGITLLRVKTNSARPPTTLSWQYEWSVTTSWLHKYNLSSVYFWPL